VAGLALRSLRGLPEIALGADLGLLLAEAIAAQTPPLTLSDEHIVVLAQKAVSKAEGALVRLDEVQPSARALRLAAEAELHGGQARHDPRVIQVVLDESTEVLRAQRGLLICRTRHGFVCANAGVDSSNSPQTETVIVLPKDPDASARAIRRRLRELTGCAPGVLITDSFGRAWRHGQCDVAIGLAGVMPLEDWRGRTDAHGRELRATWLAVADAIAAAADLARSKDSSEPAIVVEGLQRLITAEDGPGAVALIRPPEEDLFR
jgi:coenzyme F420-0:L-glutamate ligase / coenzyme F420-1:gamma-L-glutamate ligase